MAQDPGKLDIGALITQSLAAAPAAGSATAADLPFIPLWKVRPKTQHLTVNPGQFGDGEDLRSAGGGMITGGRHNLTVDPSKTETMHTADQAASAFLDLSAADRAEFQKKAIESGLVNPGQDGVSPAQLFEAWQRATNYAATYNKDRDSGKWISPWEATDRMGVLGVAGSGGAYDPFKPHSQTSTTRRDFTKGGDSEAVTRSLETIFNEEMGRAPTKAERTTYQRLVQKAYDANPETTTTNSQTDASGNTTSNSTQSGGVDMTATLLDNIRDTPESDAYQAGSTFFEAAMRSLGAIA